MRRVVVKRLKSESGSSVQEYRKKKREYNRTEHIGKPKLTPEDERKMKLSAIKHENKKKQLNPKAKANH